MKNILIAYSTWSGTTREVAERISNNLKKEYRVNLKPAREVDSISDCDGIILGTSIHAGIANKEFRKFLNRFMPALSKKPVSVFVVCANMIDENESNLSETREWLQKSLNKHPELKPISIGYFGGAVLTETKEFQESNFIIQKIILAMKSKMLEDYGKSDFRDWGKIDLWSAELADKFGR